MRPAPGWHARGACPWAHGPFLPLCGCRHPPSPSRTSAATRSYTNNRSSSYVHNGTLNILPGLSADIYGANAVANGLDLNIWGGDPATLCTSNAFYGCERTGALRVLVGVWC